MPDFDFSALSARSRTIDGLLRAGVACSASHVLITPGHPAQFRVGGELIEASTDALSSATVRAIAEELLDERARKSLAGEGDVELELILPPLAPASAIVSRTASDFYIGVNLLPECGS